MSDKTHYNNSRYKIELYSTVSGAIPFKEFIFGLNREMQIKIIRNIDYLASEGNNIRFPISKKVEKNLF